MAKPVVAKPAPPVTQPASGPAPEATPVDEPSSPTDATPGDQSDADQDAQNDAAEDQAKVSDDAPPVAAERIAILTPGGPLLVDVRLTLDGKPYDSGLAHLVKEVLAAGDTDGDKRPTWKELSGNTEYVEKQSPDGRHVGVVQLNEWLDLYDFTPDGRIQPDEAAAWLGRGAGRTARAFALRTRRTFSPDPRTTSRMWPLLDSDADGRLSADELGRAADRLWLRDADDDRIIASSELASLRDQLNAAAGMAMRQTRGPAVSRLAALHLEEKSDLERVDYVLQDMYAPLQDLAASSFAALPKLFDELDADGDKWLRREELANLRFVPAHVELSVAFEREATDGKPRAKIEVQRHADEVEVLPGASADRAWLALGKTRIVLAAQDLTVQAGPREGAPAPDAYGMANASLQQTQIRMVVHDESDALFDALDANADGRLGEREIATAPVQLARGDANGDGALAGDEAPYEMIVAFVRGEPLGERSFTTPPSLAAAADAAAPAWFAFADLNRDGDVSRREFVGSAEQFARLDADGDGFVVPAEVNEPASN